MKFEGNYSFLNNDFQTPITIMGNTYTCATAAILALRCENELDRKLFTNVDAETARKLAEQLPERLDWEETEIDAITAVLSEKFKDPTLMKRLKLVPYDTIIYETEDDARLGVVNGIGGNYLGQVLTLIRDGNLNIHDVVENFEEHPHITYIHPGQIMVMPDNPKRVLAKMPWPNINGTISIIIPRKEISDMDDTVQTGHWKGEHYKQAILNEDAYLTVTHDALGRPTNDNALVEPAIETSKMVSTYTRNRAILIEHAKRNNRPGQASLKLKTKTALEHIMDPNEQKMKQISFCDYKSSVLDNTNWKTKNEIITVKISTYENLPSSMKLEIVNRVTKEHNEVTIPPIMPISVPIPKWCCFVDVQGIRDQVDALIVNGILIPMRLSNGQSYLVDARGYYIAHFFAVQPKIAMGLDPKGATAYHQNYVTEAFTIADTRWMDTRELPPETLSSHDLEEQSFVHDAIAFDPTKDSTQQALDRAEKRHQEIVKELSE